MPLTWPELVALGRILPAVEEGTWYGTPSLKVRGKSFLRLKEGGQAVVFLLETVEEQEFLIQAAPDIYFITDHYRGYPAILARLSALDETECMQRLEEAWGLKAPKSLRP